MCEVALCVLCDSFTVRACQTLIVDANGHRTRKKSDEGELELELQRHGPFYCTPPRQTRDVEGERKRLLAQMQPVTTAAVGARKLDDLLDHIRVGAPGFFRCHKEF